jgi:hypothetical protein
LFLQLQSPNLTQTEFRTLACVRACVLRLILSREHLDF